MSRYLPRLYRWETLAFCALLLAGGWGGVARGEAQTRSRPRLELGEPAPEISAQTLEGKPVSLAGLRSAHPDRILVLQFGSITEPVFRARVPAVEKLAAKEADKAQFVVVYQQEAHPADSERALALNEEQGFAMTQPVTEAERVKLAQQAAERLGIKNQEVVVDAWNNFSALRYGSYPNMTFIVDARGNLQAGYAWMDAAKVQSAIEALAAGKALAGDLRGSVKPSAPGAFDYTAAALDMTGGRGPGGAALALEKMNLTPAQREAVYPALAQYLADIQKLRAARSGKPIPGTVKVDEKGAEMPHLDADAALAEARQSAAKLKTTLQENLSAKDAGALMDVLEQGPAGRLFDR